MKRLWLITLACVVALSATLASAPQRASAAISSLTVAGDCTHAAVTVTFSGAGDAYQDTLISAETSSGGLDGAYVTIPSSNSVSVTLSWSALPKGTTIKIDVDHYIQGQGLVDFASRSYTCGDPVAGGGAPIYAPETDDRVVITADMPVYGGPDLGQAVPGAQVAVGQEFLMVDSKVVGDITWYQIFIGGAYPWVPSLGAYTIKE